MTEHEITRATGTIRWIEPGGLDRFDGLDLVEELVGRDLTDGEQSWATALDEQVDGVPRVLVLAAAVIRARAEADLPADADAAEITALLVEGCDAQARQMVRVLESLRPRGEESSGAAPLGADHLALLTASAVADTTGAVGTVDAALAQAEALVATGLVEAETDAYGVRRYRVADGVSIGDNAAGWIPAVAQELAAWASRVGPLEASGEAEAAIAALRGAVALERLPVARMLARAMAPALAATLRWDQWGTVLEAGRDASLRATANGDAGYFHHELAIRALCLGDAEDAALELTAAIKAYDDAGDARRGGVARRSATVAGIALPDAVVAVPEPKGALAKRYKGSLAVGGGAKKVTVGTASAMVLFGVAGVSMLFGVVGGGRGASGGGGSGSTPGVTQNVGQDQTGGDQGLPFYNPLIIAGASPPAVTVARVDPQSPAAAQSSGGAALVPQHTTPSPSHSFLQPTSTGAAPSQAPQLPGLSSYVPPPNPSTTVAPPPTSTVATLPPVSTPPVTTPSTTVPPVTTPPVTPTTTDSFSTPPPATSTGP